MYSCVPYATPIKALHHAHRHSTITRQAPFAPLCGPLCAPITAPAASATKPKLYNPRHPERTLLYQTIAEHFETWHELASAGQFDGQGDHHTPKSYVRQAFRKYLECGIFAHGFARARCDDCGHDYFVAFSCKGRGVCPSCNTRRMVETAAHLGDHVFPRLPVRQWVLSIPKRLRYFMQRDGAALNMVLRTFLRVIDAHSGFSVDASVCIEAHDRAGLERLLRYCARPPFAMERLRKAGAALVYRCAKQRSEPTSDKRGAKADELTLTPLELIDRIAALVPPPRTHRHRYFGVLAPNSPLRAAVTAMAVAAPAQAEPAATGEGVAGVVAQGNALPPSPESAPSKRAAHYLWAVLIARIYEVFPLVCPICGGQMRIIAFITHSADIRQILEHIGVESEPPHISPARGPPLWEECDAQGGEGVEVEPDWHLAAQPAPDYEVDQRVNW